MIQHKKNGYALFAIMGLLLLLLMNVSCRADRDIAGVHQTEQRGRLASLQEKAEQGDGEAQAYLGFMYYRGNSVEQDYEQAHKWFSMAAEQGISFAQLGLGTMYSAGLGVPQDDTEAARWYGKAAEQGNVGCQYRLGTMFHEGVGVKQCCIQAYKWLTLAAMQGVTQAETLRDRLASEMTSEQIEEGQKLAREWMAHHKK
jgi:uncharacterized protein